MKTKSLPLELVELEVSPSFNFLIYLCLSWVDSPWLLTHLWALCCESALSLLCLSLNVCVWIWAYPCVCPWGEHCSVFVEQHRKYRMEDMRDSLQKFLEFYKGRNLTDPIWLTVADNTENLCNWAISTLLVWWIFPLKLLSTFWLFSANDYHSFLYFTYTHTLLYSGLGSRKGT